MRRSRAVCGPLSSTSSASLITDMPFRPVHVTVIGAAATAFAIVAALAYAPHYYFLLDDPGLVVSAREASIADVFSTALLGFYRPLVFVLFKLQHSIFGWERPGAYATVSIAAHACAAIVFSRVLIRSGFSEHVSLLACLLFLASPWATEAVFWVSAQFDIFAALFGLLSILVFCFHLERPSSARLFGAAALYMAALLAKENAAAFIVFFAAVAVRHAGRLRVAQLARLVSPFAVALGLYFLLRSRVLPVTGGAYGSLGSLYAQPDLVQHAVDVIRTFVILSKKFWERASALSFVYSAASVACLIAAARKPVLAGTMCLLLLASCAPVLWAHMTPNVTTSGRLLYAPGLVWCALVGIGASEIHRLSTGRFAASVRVLGLAVLAVAFASTASQVRLWRYAAELARSTAVDLLSRPDLDAPVLDVERLPLRLIQGPFVFRADSLLYVLRAAGHARPPTIVANLVMVSPFDPKLVVSVGQQTAGAGLAGTAK